MTAMYAASFKVSLGRILGISLLGMLISFGVRMLELPAWSDPQLQSNGEHLLATHDAYAWAAGAVDANPQTANFPSAELLRITSEFSGAPPGEVAFWAAPILAVLAVVPLILWAEILELSYMSLPIALLGTLAPAYYTRTRLGYYDTDWATYFFPLLISGLLALWVKPRTHACQDEKRALDSSHNYLHLLLIMLAILCGVSWHGFIGLFVFVMLVIGEVLAFVIVPRESRNVVLSGLTAIGITTLWGWIGYLFAGILLLATRGLKMRSTRWRHVLLSIMLLSIMLLLARQVLPGYAIERIARYLPSLGVRETVRESSVPWIYPTLSSSVRETQPLGLSLTVEGMSFAWWLGLLGSIGFLILLCLQPLSLFLTLLAIVGVSSLWIGPRFTMFAHPPLMLGLGYLLKNMQLIQKRVGFHYHRVIVALIAGFLLLAPAMTIINYQRLPVIPVISQAHANALRELNSLADSPGTIWTWWDYGYASQYYSGLATFADGGRNVGPRLYTLSRALVDTEYLRAIDLIQFTASAKYKPWERWEACLPKDFEQCLEEIRQTRIIRSHDPQYLILQWDALELLPWMTYFGTWDFNLQQGQRASITYLNESGHLFLEQGLFQVGEDNFIYLDTIDLLGPGSVEHFEFRRSQDGVHLMVNELTEEIIILDDQAYRSTFVQLLIAPVGSLSSEPLPELVLDNLPFVRIFRVD
jgi:hypothetical protein